jgi:CDP-paratose 2-epimerase
MSHVVDTIRQPAPEPDRRRAPARSSPTGREPGVRPQLGAVQYFHMGDHGTVERVAETLRRTGIERLRTSISWCDWTRPGGERWYRWLLGYLTERFSVLPCILYTPPELGIAPKTSSPPRDPAAYGEFVELVLRRHGDCFPYVELWNEPNNYIEWDWTIDPEWTIFAAMIAGAAERAARLGTRSVLGGMSPFDPNWLDLMFRRGALEHVDVIGVHGFPGTWEAVWEGWEHHVARVREVTERHGRSPEVWITEAGYSTWAHDEFRQLETIVELCAAPVQRAYWYSIEDLAPERETLDGFHRDERAYHFGLSRHGGDPKLLGRVLGERGLEGVCELVSFAQGAREQRRPLRARRRSSPGRVLSTGGAGFIGAHLADRLAASGTPVTVLDSLSRAGVEDNARWLKRRHGERVALELGDVRDRFAVRRALDGCERVFHLAAQVAVTSSLRNPREDLEVNVGGTINVLEEARRLPEPPAILFTSTNKVYGSLSGVPLVLRQGGYVPEAETLRASGISERQPLALSSPYGCSKGAADQYVLDYCSSLGLRTCVLRMSCIYGPLQQGTEDQGWVAHFLRAALEGRTITIYGDGCQTRDLLFVDDLIDAFELASRSDAALAGGAFNIGGGASRAASVNRVLEMIGELLGRAPEVRFEQWRVADQRYYVSDTSAFAALTGWRAQVGIEDGLRRLHDWLAGAAERPAALAAAGGAA